MNYKWVFELWISFVAGIHFIKLSSKLHFLASLEPAAFRKASVYDCYVFKVILVNIFRKTVLEPAAFRKVVQDFCVLTFFI